MNPSKPLMALGAALLVAAPSVVRADDSDWKPIRTKSQTYYVGKDSFGEYEKMQKPPKGLKKAGPIALFVDEKAEGQPVQKNPSGATLNCASNTSTRKAKGVVKKITTWDCAITANARTGGAYHIPVTVSDKQPEVATSVLEAAAQRPADVSQEVWAEVVSGKHKPAIPEAKWVQAARDVQKVVDSPKGQKMLAADTHNMNLVINAVAAEIAKGTDDATIVQKAIDLAEPLKVAGTPRNIPGAPTVAQSGATGGAGDGSGDGRAQAVDGANVLNTLTLLLAQDQVQEDLFKRLARFVEDAKGDEAYLDVDGHPEALKPLEEGLAAEIKKLCSDDVGRGKAAVLYFMLGDTAKPWFGGYVELKALTQDQKMRGYFTEYMKPWTKKGSGVPSVTNAGRYTGDQKWPPAFVADALVKADKTWKDPRVKGQIKLNIDQNDQGLPVVGDIKRGSGLGSDLNNLAAITFDEDTTWEHGAVVQMVQIPGSKPPAYRKIAMKLVAQQTAWGPPPVIEDRMMVVDITNKTPDGGQTPSSFFGRYFSIQNNFTNKGFPMDKTDPSSIKYSFSMSGGQLTLTALNAKGKPGSEPFTASISDLYKAREDELNNKRDSYVTELNGQRFRVIAQPGRYTGLAYFAADANGRVVENKPSLMVDLAQYGKPLLTNGVPNDRPLGFIGTDDGGKPQFWFMHYNADTKMYEYKKGDAPTDPPYDPMAKVTPPPVAGGTTGATPTAGATAAATTDSSATPTAGGDSNNPADPSVAGAKISDCNSDWSKNFGASQNKDELYRKDGSWMLFSNGKADPTQVNTTWMCVYKNMGIYFEGLIPKGAISINGDEKSGTLKVTAVKQGPPDPDSPDKGQILIKPSEADNLTVKDGQIVYGQNKSRNVAQATDYVFKLSTLKTNLMKGNAAYKLGATTKLDWVEQTRDYNQGNQNPSFLVYAGPGDDAKALFMEAVKTYGGDNTLCKNGSEVSDVVAKYIDAAVNDAEFKQALTKVDMTQISVSRPNIEFKCLAQGTNVEGAWNLAVPSWPSDSSKILVVRNGKVDTTTGYASK